MCSNFIHILIKLFDGHGSDLELGRRSGARGSLGRHWGFVNILTVLIILLQGHNQYLYLGH